MKLWSMPSRRQQLFENSRDYKVIFCSFLNSPISLYAELALQYCKSVKKCFTFKFTNIHPSIIKNSITKSNLRNKNLEKALKSFFSLLRN